MKPILAIDIDEVLSETNRYVLPLFTKEHGLCISYEEVTDHWLPNLPMCTLDGPTTIQSYRRFMNYPESHVGCIPVLGALEGLKKLWKTFSLIAVTARHVSNEVVTRRWLEAHFSQVFSEVHFLGHDTGLIETKGGFCARRWAVALVDDCFEYIESTAELGIPGILLERPWNRNRSEVHSHIHRAPDWSSVVHIISSLFLWKSS